MNMGRVSERGLTGGDGNNAAAVPVVKAGTAWPVWGASGQSVWAVKLAGSLVANCVSAFGERRVAIASNGEQLCESSSASSGLDDASSMGTAALPSSMELFCPILRSRVFTLPFLAGFFAFSTEPGPGSFCVFEFGLPPRTLAFGVDRADKFEGVNAAPIFSFESLGSEIPVKSCNDTSQSIKILVAYKQEHAHRKIIFHTV